MALKWVDGFDHYTEVGVTGPTVQKYLEAAGYTVRNATSSTFAVVDGRQDGQRALQFTVAANASVIPSISWGFTSSASLVVFAFALKASGTRMRICRIENVVDVEWDATTGRVKIGSTLGASVLILNAWYLFEVEMDVTNQEVRVWANNELQLTYAWTEAAPATYTITWGQTATQTVSGVQEIDDFYVLDNASGTRIARLGPCAVISRLPTADVEVAWDIVNPGGATINAHYEVAGQLSALETNKPYLQSNVNGAQDIFRSNAVLPNNNAIYGVGVVALARKGDLDERSLGLKMNISGTDSETQIALTESYKYLQATIETPPGGGEWSQNAVESATFGIVAR